MVINIVSPHASHYLGGMEVVTIQMARQLARQGVQVRFFTRHIDTKSDVYTQLCAEVGTTLQIIEVPLLPDCPLADGTWPTFYRVSCAFGVAAQPYFSQYHDADLFVTHLSVDSLFIPSTNKTVLHLHGTPGLTDPLMEAAMQLPVTTVAHSKSIQNWWCDTFPAISPIVFHNGIDTTFYSGNPNDTRDIDILYVGRFLEHKGVDDILHAVKPSQRVVIAGNGPYLKQLVDLIAQLGLIESVTVIDTPSTSTIRDLYRRAKIFACPSRGREGLLTTLLEAGATGCAVVTASGSGMTDLVEHDRNGLVIKPGDISALSSSFEALLANSDERIRLASALQSDITGSWSWQQRCIELEKFYRAQV